MVKVLVMAVVAVVVGVVGPVGADGDGAQVSDPCGDANALVWSGGETVVAWPDERADGFDVKAASFEDIMEGEEPVGVRVTLELCGEVPDPLAPYAMWRVSWSLDDPDESCSGSVYLSDAPSGDGVERTARFQKGCTRPGEDILGRPSSEGYTRFSHVLDAYESEGGRIVWELRRDAFTGEAAEVLAPDTVWARPRADARDTGAQMFMLHMGNAGVRGGADDAAGQGRDFVVAEEPDRDV